MNEMITEEQLHRRNSILSHTPVVLPLLAHDPRSNPDASVESLLEGMEYIRAHAAFWEREAYALREMMQNDEARINAAIRAALKEVGHA